jgi:hypothetical protein
MPASFFKRVNFDRFRLFICRDDDRAGAAGAEQNAAIFLE